MIHSIVFVLYFTYLRIDHHYFVSSIYFAINLIFFFHFCKEDPESLDLWLFICFITGVQCYEFPTSYCLGFIHSFPGEHMERCEHGLSDLGRVCVSSDSDSLDWFFFSFWVVFSCFFASLAIPPPTPHQCQPCEFQLLWGRAVMSPYKEFWYWFWDSGGNHLIGGGGRGWVELEQ